MYICTISTCCWLDFQPVLDTYTTLCDCYYPQAMIQTCFIFIYFSRYYCSHPQDTVGPPGRLKRYLISRFVRLVAKCETFVETKNPSIFKVYNTFKVGKFKLFQYDTSYTISYM